MDYLGAIFQLGTAVFPKHFLSIVCRIMLKVMGVIFVDTFVYIALKLL